MAKEEIFVNDVSEYLQVINVRYAQLFRGVSKRGYALTPSVGRDIPIGVDITNYEIEVLKKFREQSVAYLDSTSKSDWELLMIAQHHGMQTRLLDWTAIPFVALFFACEKDYDDDGKVYRLDQMEKLDTARFPNPFSISKDYVIRPPHISPRIAAQSAFFTISRDPRQSLELSLEYHKSGDYHKIIIPCNRKVGMLAELNRYGINHAMLFPGLDGVSKKLNFELFFLKDAISKNTDFSDH